MANAVAKYGTFKDSLSAPVHRWFTYPAGYSYRLVEAKVTEFGLSSRSLIADPFVGTGTTSLAAKKLGIDSIGVEAHPFVHWVARTKLDLNHDTDLLRKEAKLLLEHASDIRTEMSYRSAGWPELVEKCFDQENLAALYALRTAILELGSERQAFFKLALTAALRDATSAGAGWPYIAPSKFAERKVRRDAFDEFTKRCAIMVEDVEKFIEIESFHSVINGDARKLASYVNERKVDMILTSPPYLNNYDYADRTRLETYFWGLYDSWADITANVRNKLMMAATTQVHRNKMARTIEMSLVRSINPLVHAELSDAVSRLGILRKQKSGKKSYDLMTAGYFEDMARVITQAHSVLKPGCPFILVLGDSAPYGVHIPTDEFIGKLALGAGFTSFSVEVIRNRGNKWPSNAQRHKVPLRESIVTVTR